MRSIFLTVLMFFLGSEILLSQRVSGRGLEPSGSYGGEGGSITLIIIGFIIFVVYSIYKGVNEEKVKNAELNKRKAEELRVDNISESIKEYFLSRFNSNEETYDTKYQIIASKVSECIVKHRLGDIHKGLVSAYIFYISTSLNGLTAHDLDKKIQEHYHLLEHVNLSFMGFEYKVKYLYKKNNNYLLKITEYLISEEVYEYITPNYMSVDLTKEKLLELKNIYRKKIE